MARLATLLAAAAVVAAAHAVPAAAAEHRVVIDGSAYHPEVITVRAGDTVVWVNEDPFPHTVTAPGAFDSRSIAANASWRMVAKKRGEYRYACTLHPNMHGTVRVE